MSDRLKLHDKVRQGSDPTRAVSTGKVVHGLNVDSGRTMTPGIELWGHQLSLDGGSSFECEYCEMEESVPELVQMSSGFREVAYKLYILGRFRSEECVPKFEADRSVLRDNTTNVGYDPNSVHWTDSGQHIMQFDLPDGYVVTDGSMVHESTSSQYYAGDVITDKEYVKLSNEAADADVLNHDTSDSSDSDDSHKGRIRKMMEQLGMKDGET